VPNVFSPNGDGQNDILFVRGEGVSKLLFIIYDRWGEKVFESKSMSEGWDGTYRGAKLDPGVFFYYVKATFKNNTASVLEGNVTLIK
jgi:gliding motility-associated-like protein